MRTFPHIMRQGHIPPPPLQKRMFPVCPITLRIFFSPANLIFSPTTFTYIFVLRFLFNCSFSIWLLCYYYFTNSQYCFTTFLALHKPDICRKPSDQEYSLVSVYLDKKVLETKFGKLLFVNLKITGTQDGKLQKQILTALLNDLPFYCNL